MSDSTEQSDSHPAPDADAPNVNVPADPSRRNFVAEAGSLIMGAAIGLFSLAVGCFTFLDPILRKKQKPRNYAEGEGGDGFVQVAVKSALPADGAPVRFAVIDDQIDAWNFTPDVPVGAVYISLQPGGGGSLRVFNTTCPHAGCSVSCDGQAFLCPCHNSAFNLDGTKIDRQGKENPSPRPLDELDYDQQKFADTGEIWVRFENFYTGIEEKRPKL